MTSGLLERQESLLGHFVELNETLEAEKIELLRVESMLTNQTIELGELEMGEGQLMSGLSRLQSKFDTVKVELNSNDQNIQRDMDKLAKSMVAMEAQLRETIKKHAVEVSSRGTTQ